MKIISTLDLDVISIFDAMEQFTKDTGASILAVGNGKVFLLHNHYGKYAWVPIIGQTGGGKVLGGLRDALDAATYDDYELHFFCSAELAKNFLVTTLNTLYK